MTTSNILDLVDALLSCICGIAENNKLDINISIGMVCRIILFIVMISTRDLITNPFGDIFVQIFAWFIFHVYIICYEKEYFQNGQSREYLRKKHFKIMDSLQLIIGILYLAFTVNSEIELVVFVIFIINLFLSLCELIKLLCDGETDRDNNYKEEGGYAQMYLGFLLGAVGVIIFLIDAASRYSEELAESPFQTTLYITLVGEFIVVIWSFIYFCCRRELFKWSKNCAKGPLGFLYGLNIGLFSIFYGYLTCLTIIFYLIYLMFKSCIDTNSNKRVQVHPN